jgi:hypothetical protein
VCYYLIVKSETRKGATEMPYRTSAQEAALELRRQKARVQSWRRSQEREARRLTAKDGKPRRVIAMSTTICDARIEVVS